jgi:class 3 adenylate cyclase
MMERAEQCTWGEGHPFKLKIGLNQGRAIAGVIGDHKPQFSLIGDVIFNNKNKLNLKKIFLI